jgi:hypothetical protein
MDGDRMNACRAEHPHRTAQQAQLSNQQNALSVEERQRNHILLLWGGGPIARGMRGLAELSGRGLVMEDAVSGGRKVRVDRCAVGQLTLPDASAIHSVCGMNEPKLAPHVRAVRCSELRDHAPAVVRDEVWRGVCAPVVPTPPADSFPPARIPQRPDAIDCRVFGDLKVLPAIGLAAAHRCGHGSRNAV